MSGDMMRLRQHVMDIATAFDVTLLGDDSIPREFGVSTGRSHLRVVICRPVDDETSYAVAMHELGHTLAPSGSIRAEVYGGNAAQDEGRDLRLKLIEEHAAWEWAEQNALYWSAAMETVKQWSIKSYEDAYGQYCRELAAKVEAAKAAAAVADAAKKRQIASETAFVRRIVAKRKAG